MRAESLSAERRVLEAAEARASSEAAELSKERFRLAAELEAARRAGADREAALVAELTAAKDEVRDACPPRWGAPGCLGAPQHLRRDAAPPSGVAQPPPALMGLAWRA
jgi:hypothetical protein